MYSSILYFFLKFSASCRASCSGTRRGHRSASVVQWNLCMFGGMTLNVMGRQELWSFCTQHAPSASLPLPTFIPGKQFRRRLAHPLKRCSSEGSVLGRNSVVLCNLLWALYLQGESEMDTLKGRNGAESLFCRFSQNFSRFLFFRERQRGGKPRQGGKHTGKPLPKNVFGPPHLQYVSPLPFLGDSLSFPLKERGTGQTNPTF